MSNLESSSTPLLKAVLELLLKDFRYWLGLMDNRVGVEASLMNTWHQLVQERWRVE
ncbi:MAG TPA: hypothetical protein V6D18_12495 [Thermosynechococcaceae cyanobacterium]